MDHGSHQWHKGQPTASLSPQGSHWPVHSSINQKLCGGDVTQIASCVLLFWGFLLFFSARLPSETQYGASFSFLPAAEESRMVFKHLNEHRETQAGAYFTPVASWRSFWIHLKSLAQHRRSLTNLKERKKKGARLNQRVGGLLAECSGALNTVWDDAMEESNTQLTQQHKTERDIKK